MNVNMEDNIEGVFVGKIVGELTVIEMGPRQSINTVWLCRCSCGGTKIVSTRNLRDEKTTHCGCLSRHKPLLGYIGYRHNHITVIEKLEGRKWLCKCDCGNIREFQDSILNKNKTCGCDILFTSTTPVGNKFGKLTILDNAEAKFSKTGEKIYRILCKCDCGNETIKERSSVLKGQTTSCGCLVKEQKTPMVGRTFGKLKVISEVEQGKVVACKIRWNCICACGKELQVTGVDLRRNVRTSCGCDKVRIKKIKEPKPKKSSSKVGLVIGRLSVLSVISGSSSLDFLYRCKCSCGKVVSKSHAYLNSTKDKSSCGCNRKIPVPKNKLNLIGNRYGILTVLREGPRLEYNGKKKGKYSTFICRCDCGNELPINASKLNIGRVISCGCLTPASAKKLKIKKKSSKKERDEFRKSPEYTEWRTKVFSRDGYKCVCCGGKRDGINAHHLEDYQSNPDLRIIVDNGVTLCVVCHKKFHNRYGWFGRTTKEQFEEFVREKLYK